jgi:hypothetical protein
VVEKMAVSVCATKMQAGARKAFPLFFQQGGVLFQAGGVLFQRGGIIFQEDKN